MADKITRFDLQIDDNGTWLIEAATYGEYVFFDDYETIVDEMQERIEKLKTAIEEVKDAVRPF